MGLRLHPHVHATHTQTLPLQHTPFSCKWGVVKESGAQKSPKSTARESPENSTPETHNRAKTSYFPQGSGRFLKERIPEQWRCGRHLGGSWRSSVILVGAW